MTIFAYVLFPLAAFCAWLFGRRSYLSKKLGLPMRLQRDYFRGLNYLINDQPDKAVDVFIKLMEIDSDTVETHLALGGLFRRRGEVDRAIKIHQNLIARPQLEPSHKHQALLELGEDYLSAGVLDRAEQIFLELSERDKQDGRSLTLLLQIYHQEKEWHKAIKIAQRLAAFSGQSYRLHIAQYYCELCEVMMSKKQTVEANLFLKKAQSIDRHCVRAHLLHAETAMSMFDYDQAITSYERVMLEDSSFVTEILDSLAVCYEKKQQYPSFVRYLESVFAVNPLVDIAYYLAKDMRKQHGLQTAIDFLENYVAAHASLRTLKPLIKMYADSSPTPDAQKLLKLERHMDLILAEKPVYCCLQCGFSGKTLYWLCPSCQTWSSTKPIRSIDVLSREKKL